MRMQWKKVIAEAAIEASKAHRRLGVDPRVTNVVDIFGAIEADKVVLMFQPLGSLAAVYIPAGETNPAGILINEKLPLTRQRYSAAHEYCHHLRKDPVSIDTEMEMFEMFSLSEYKKDDHERIAESFAAHFLMPKPILVRLIHQMGIEPDKMEPIDVYNISLRMGCSYMATVNQLSTTRIISDQKRKQIMKIPPKRIKQILGTDGLASQWNDVWALSKNDHGILINPIVGDTIRVVLPENATTGYVWEATIQSDRNSRSIAIPPLNLLSSFHKGSGKAVGGSGWTTFLFTTTQSGDATLTFSHLKPWMPDDPLEMLRVRIYVGSKRHGVNVNLLTG